ncbi:sensor histidine kinase, partial [Pseudomonas syringae group genomosp. 7]
PVDGRLQVAAGVVGSELFFSVSDEGPGIPEDERAKIFDMFYTAARGDRGGQGTGLGLAICQGMIGAHGGRLAVEEGIDGQGTRITLFLPLQTQPDVDMEESA